MLVEITATAVVVRVDCITFEEYAEEVIYANTGRVLIVEIVSVFADIVRELTVPEVVIKDPVVAV